MLIDGYIVHIDTGPVRAQTAELQKIGVNINQIARRINSTGTVYAQDLEDIKGRWHRYGSYKDPSYQVNAEKRRWTTSRTRTRPMKSCSFLPMAVPMKQRILNFKCCWIRRTKRGNNLAHHLIQAFEPGETTAEQAHEIGRQLADEVLQGKYPYVITTHIDKGHLHNHIIFCAVDMANQRKYISNRQSYAFIRRTSDRLCKEHGLSVVKPGKDKGKTYAEWDAQKKGKSWKAKLKTRHRRGHPAGQRL